MVGRKGNNLISEYDTEFKIILRIHNKTSIGEKWKNFLGVANGKNLPGGKKGQIARDGIKGKKCAQGEGHFP